MGITIVAVTLVIFSLKSSDFVRPVFSLRNETTLSLGLSSACMRGCLLGLFSGGPLALSVPALLAFNMLGPGGREETVAVFMATTEA